MSNARLTTILVAALATLSLSTTLALGGTIHPLLSSSARGYHYVKNRLNNNRRSGQRNIKISNTMGGSQSTPSMPSEGGAIAVAAAEDDKDDRSLGTQRTDENGSRSSDDVPAAPSLQPRTPQHYDPPSAPVKPLAHYIFLVHGWLGNDLEMGSLSVSFRDIISPLPAPAEGGGDGMIADDGREEREGDSSGSVVVARRAKRTKRSGSRATQELLASSEGASGVEETGPEIVVHSVKCNVRKTHDGIRNGGTRLANEIVEFVREDVRKRIVAEEDGGGDANADDRHATYSIVGNSLGGLYSRYAVSLLPYQLQLPQRQGNSQSPSGTLNLHPNVFCTTATPHLGVSRHTYLPLPRIAETIIGAGMGATGRDLFRLNSQKDLANAAAGNIVGAARGGVDAAVGGVRRLTALAPGAGKEDVEGDVGGADAGAGKELGNDEMVDDADCIVREMCLRETFLAPLRRFRRRIAYANAYGTDFQVPTGTAAFLHERSGVGHFVVASRHSSSSSSSDVGEGEEDEEGGASGKGADSEDGRGGLPPFVVAVVRTEQTPGPQSPHGDSDSSDELIRMSQSLDALGWTKVFVDLRDRIPVPTLAKPAWLKPACGSLDDLILERVGLRFRSLQKSPSEEGADDGGDSNASADEAAGKDAGEECILTSQELARSTHAGDSFDFPLGHTVMIANSKSDAYTWINSEGRPVMDNLAEEMVNDVLEFE